MTAALTNQRRRAAAWNPSVFDGVGFWPIAPGAARLRDLETFPSVSEIHAALSELAGVSFTTQEVLSKRQRRREPPAPYDLAIAKGSVPTREGSWHDLMNALVWATFPRAKQTIHALQAKEIEDARAAGWIGRRTRRHDALAVLDEGGVLLAGPEPTQIVFGHALFEAVAIDGPRPLVRALRLGDEVDPRELHAVDQALAEVLESPLGPTSPKSLEALAPSAFELNREDARSVRATERPSTC